MRIWLTIAAFALAAGPAVGQSRPTRFGEGTDAFRLLLHRARLSPVRDEPYLGPDASNQVLIVLGQTDVIDRRWGYGSLRRFLEAGGAILIATDRVTSASLNRELHVGVAGGIVSAPANRCWRNLSYCPFVEETRRANRPRHPIFQGLSDGPKIATNNPSVLTRTFSPPIATVPVRSPHFSWPGAPAEGGVESKAIAYTEDTDRGRLLVIADHSIFINDMMLQPDNDNIAFAFNVVHWLADAGNGKRRTEVYFYDDGQIRTDFDVPLEYQMPPIPPLEALVQPADEAIVDAERKNFLNEALLEMTGGLRPILRTAALLLTFALLLFGLYRFLNSRHRPEAGLVDLPPVAPGGLTAVERRHQAIVDRGNYAEAARELAHQAFAAVGLTPTADEPPPVVEVAGWLPLRGRRRARQVRSLWRLAVRGPRRRVSAGALKRLVGAVHELLAEVAAGRVRLAGAASAI